MNVEPYRFGGWHIQAFKERKIKTKTKQKIKRKLLIVVYNVIFNMTI